ncbi:MAG: 5-methyltetrahydropteroyltriglutamate--homocysteine S-methyltransferase [Chloroflexi bacterium]|nr:5-methyltetrahydropteroyltriglutamate--homocysteine S-methyltransferase [Chloroflexota bacterium]
MKKTLTQTLGYPRIGIDRQLKKALESYWKGKIEAQSLQQTFHDVQEQGWREQLQVGIDLIGVGDSTLYDHVLDWTLRLGLIPERFRDIEGLDLYFAMARGAQGIPPLKLTKWYDTNYHYLVPEIDDGVLPEADFTEFLDQVARAKAIVGDRAVPIVLGPITLLSLANLEQPMADVLEKIIPLYEDLLQALDAQGVTEVQIHEPRLVLDETSDLKPLYKRSFERLAKAGPPINLVTFFDDLGEAYPWVVELPVSAITLDFTRGDNFALVQKYGLPQGKTLGVGIVDGRNVWRTRAEQTREVLDGLGEIEDLRVSASCSLQFVPYVAAREDHMPQQLQGVLAFANEKLAEIVALGTGSTEDGLEQAWADYREFATGDSETRARLEQLRSDSFARKTPYEERRAKQIELPPFPLTTIGSFPQTAEVRRLRGRFKRKEISEAEYQAGVDAWIAYSIGAQEALGMDVLVHGEFERSDMVEYFAEKMNGFALTRFGWVQSYGNRYVRPPIIWGDVRRTSAMTVREFKKAQSFTEKPVKGMLTGPVTILNWSYSRSDIPREEVAFQIALALRDEIVDLEAAGASVIQVDEPALREGLPLKRARWEDYLRWAVDAFRLATGGARDETQVHTHMCYAEFGDIYPAIDRLNADVISIENARSGDQTLRELAQYGYGRELGPGVYDVHSANIPDVEHIKTRLRAYAKHLRPEQIWVNPDCGLKTRNWDEVLASLGNIAEAVRAIREEIEA